MNEKGAWIETFTVHDITRTMIPNFNSVKEKGPYLYAVKEIKGIRLNTYMRNMQMFLNFLRTKKVN